MLLFYIEQHYNKTKQAYRILISFLLLPMKSVFIHLFIFHYVTNLMHEAQ